MTATIALGLFACSSIYAQPQSPDKKPQRAKPDSKSKAKPEADPLALQRRTVAISLLTSLADEARGYQDQTLRARVQARAADALWNSDVDKARTLFRRAWDSASTADKEAWQRYAEERQRQSRERGGGRFIQQPPELRSEVLRLAALFDQYAPDLAPELRVQLASLASDVPDDLRTGRSRLLTRGLVAEDQTRDEGRESLERAERVADAAERDQWYARSAQLAARKGDASARDLVDKIADSDLRQRARAHVDFILVTRAIDKKDLQEAMQLLRAAELTNLQRVWALLEVARMLKKTDPSQGVEMLNEAATVGRRIGGSEVERARAMVGVATLMFELDHGRVWEALTEAVKAANSVASFSGEDAQVSHRFSSGRGTSTTNFTVEQFDLEGIFSSLAKEDLYRSIEMARGFTADTPRAIATLAVARAVLETKKDSASRTEALEIRN